MQICDAYTYYSPFCSFLTFWRVLIRDIMFFQTTQIHVILNVLKVTTCKFLVIVALFVGTQDKASTFLVLLRASIIMGQYSRLCSPTPHFAQNFRYVLSFHGKLGHRWSSLQHTKNHGFPHPSGRYPQLVFLPQALHPSVSCFFSYIDRYGGCLNFYARPFVSCILYGNQLQYLGSLFIRLWCVVLFYKIHTTLA